MLSFAHTLGKDPIDGLTLRLQGAVSPDARFTIFSLEQPEAALEAVEQVLAGRTGYLGPSSNVAILPLLETDPGPDGGDEAWEHHEFEQRSQVRLIAPRRRAKCAPLRIISPGPRTSELRAVLVDAGLRVPDSWNADFSRQLANRRRWTEVAVPCTVDAAQILDFSCRALSALDTDRVTGRWIVVPSGRASLFSR
jgi:hypothetical protein